MAYRDNTFPIIINTILISIPFLIYLYTKIQKKEKEKAEKNAKTIAENILRKERHSLESEIKKQKEDVFNLKSQIEKERQSLENEKIIQDKLFKEKTIGCPWVADIYSNFVELKYIFEGVDKLMTSRHLCAIRLHERKTAMP